MTQTVNPNLIQPSTQQHEQADHSAAVAPISSPPFKDLTFPLNVYAHALLLARLPSPPCRILEVGVGLGTTLSLLSHCGYDVHGLTPDAQQIAYIHNSLGSDAAINCLVLQDLTVEPESFDVVLFQESAQYIEPLVIFNKALDLLPLSGDLLIIDKFALKYDETGTGGLHRLDDLIAQAGRFGFELVICMDLSAMAAPTLDYLLQITATHRQNLIKDLALTDEQLTRLDESNRTYRKKDVSGHYGYALLHFRKKTIPKWRLQILEESHIPEMLDLFKKTFNHDMTSAMWQWKYGSNSDHEIGIWRENKLIAHYGGMSRKILLFGQPQTAVQIGDVMVDATERGTLTRKGPFFLMAATFLERYIGYGKPYLIGFGFPNERAMKVAERCGLYAEVGRMVEFSWKTRSRFPLWGTRLHLIDHAQATFAATAVNACWQSMAADLHSAIVGVRDWQYLQRRYLDHPAQHYQIMLVKNRFSERARGVMVLRYDPEGCEIIDVIAPLAEIPLLITHARRVAGAHGATRVFCRITENFADYFAVAGGARQPINIRIPTNIWSDGPAPDILNDHWWLMSGDMDFR